MARKSAGFIDLHAEKLTLGLCAVLVIGAAVFSLGGGRFTVNDLGPAELCQKVGEAGEQARQAVLGARPATDAQTTRKDPTQDAVAALKKWYGQSAEGLIQIAGVDPMLERTQPFPPVFVAVAGDSGEGRRNLAQIVAPDLPVIVTEVAEFQMPAEKPTLAEWDSRSGGPRDSVRVERAYVSVGAQVDLVKQDANFRAENYPDGSYLEVVEVRLQRRDLNDPRRGWEDVDTYLPFQPFDRPRLTIKASRSFKFEGLDDFRRLINTGAEAIARPPLPSKSVQLPEVPFLDEPPKNEEAMPPGEAAREAERRAKSWLDRAKAALAGRRPFDAVDLDAAFILARAAAGTIGAPERLTKSARDLMEQVYKKMPRDRRSLINPNAMPTPDRLMPLVAHDLDALPGHTYVYRMKYEVFNIYAGNPAELASLEDAKSLTVASGWSPESRPVEVKSDTYFYLTKADARKGEVTFTVFKMSRKGPEKKEYRVKIGEEIGRKERRGSKGDFSTGTICVDIDFDRLFDGKKDVSVVCMNPADGRLQERILSVDRRDPNYEKLNGRRASR